jgi:diacylglycerol kinase family enzyme
MRPRGGTANLEPRITPVAAAATAGGGPSRAVAADREATMATDRVTGVSPVTGKTERAYRWLARSALAAAVAAIVVVLAFAGVRGSLYLIMVGTIGSAVTLVAAWWFLSRRGMLRWVALAIAAAAPIVVVVLYARERLLWVAALSLGLWAVAVMAGRAALADAGPAMIEYEVPPPRRPFLIMNPRSGDGKVGRFGLVDLARNLGAEVAVLDGPGFVDVTDLARSAVGRGCDLLGVAGGDGTQALVAGIAAEHDLPFMVITAGTRNHFALDLGLDRTDPRRCLDALTDGVELRVDLGTVADRPFVNNASFGAYAELVLSPAYRAGKAKTTLDLLPGLLVGRQRPHLAAHVGDRTIKAPQALLVSNNPYAATDLAGLGRRARLDGGTLGVLAVRVDNAAQAAGLLRRRATSGIIGLTAREVIVEAHDAEIPVGIDGEAAWLRTPVRCLVRTGALRVRVPRHRPNAAGPAAQVDWRLLGRRALPAGRRVSGVTA